MGEIKTSVLYARLFATDLTVTEVREVSVASPASSGKIKVSIPYPADKPPKTIARVAVINHLNGNVMRAALMPEVPVEPGDTLNVEFGEDNPGTARDPRLDAIAANVASLNEIVAEMTAKVSDDPEFVTMVRELLRGHSHALGFQFQGDGGGR